MSISSSAQINEPNEDDTAKDTQEMQDAQPISGELEGRKRTLTERVLSISCHLRRRVMKMP